MVRILLAYEREGLDYAPSVPTFEKMGYGFDAPLCAVICGPKDIPSSIKDKLEKALIEGMKSDMFRSVAKKQEFMVPEKPLVGPELVEYLKSQSAFFQQSLTEAGLAKGQKKQGN